MSIEDARKKQIVIGLDNFTPVQPKVIGKQIVEVDLETLVPYIDWTPFSELGNYSGKYPAILTDEVVGEQATLVFADAQAMLKSHFGGEKLTAKGVYGIFPANQINDDDIEVEDENGNPLQTFLTLRQSKSKKPKGANIRCLILLRQKKVEKWI